MKLIIAEKPSQALTYAEVIGNHKKLTGYYEAGDYCIVWCYGHLVSLCKDSVYHNQPKWSLDYLPLIVDQYQYEADSDKGKLAQIQTIKTLAEKAELIINGTDADREGEAIFRNIIKVLQLKKPIKRLWLNSLEKSVIETGLANLKTYTIEPDKDIHISLKNTSLASELRAQFDWLYGVNATQSMTVKKGGGKILSIGRVQTAIFRLITERYLQNKSHTKSYTYQLVASHKEKGVEFQTKSKTVETEAELEALKSSCTNDFKVLNYIEKTTTEHPPLLYSLNSLIIEANKEFKYSSKVVLDECQNLYERAIISYPRTDCEYINEERYAKMKSYLSNLSESIIQQKAHLHQQPKSVDNSKLDSSHDAIVPTGITTGLHDLSEKAQNIFKLILVKTLESFSFEAKYLVKQIKLDNNGNEFNATSKRITEAGYREIRDKFHNDHCSSQVMVSKKNQVDSMEDNDPSNDDTSGDIPNLPTNQIIPGNLEDKKIESKPKPLYTGSTLTTTLMKIGQHLVTEGHDVKEIQKLIPINEVELGTDNTRVHIVEALIERTYIEFKHNKYYPTELGLKYYSILAPTDIGKVLITVENEIKLRLVEKGLMTEDEFRNQMNSYVSSVVEKIKLIESSVDMNERKSIGKCPKCKKGDMLKSDKSFFCSEYKNDKACTYSIFRTVAGKTLTDNWVTDLITKRKTPLIKGFKAKPVEGKPDREFEAHLILNENNELKFEFVENTWDKDKKAKGKTETKQYTFTKK
jgi:DNA topoisomerase-3